MPSTRDDRRGTSSNGSGTACAQSPLLMTSRSMATISVLGPLCGAASNEKARTGAAEWFGPERVDSVRACASRGSAVNENPDAAHFAARGRQYTSTPPVARDL
ncbi:hypothetical protein BN2476_470035 [Paraburkholderia piptadeniae]|uniref:Uncharacterized protein n=1 Tax=Paraburkholderia piptadeniae TaxID=1701573 RepID=A0A1N7SDQ6_9BURK|nr:hypothetical protein BN2476_470035 [Paraburkholderia piptadeniae]